MKNKIVENLSENVNLNELVSGNDSITTSLFGKNLCSAEYSKIKLGKHNDLYLNIKVLNEDRFNPYTQCSLFYNKKMILKFDLIRRYSDMTPFFAKIYLDDIDDAYPYLYIETSQQFFNVDKETVLFLNKQNLLLKYQIFEITIEKLMNNFLRQYNIYSVLLDYSVPLWSESVLLIEKIGNDESKCDKNLLELKKMLLALDAKNNEEFRYYKNLK